MLARSSRFTLFMPGRVASLVPCSIPTNEAGFAAVSARQEGGRSNLPGHPCPVLSAVAEIDGKLEIVGRDGGMQEKGLLSVHAQIQTTQEARVGDVEAEFAVGDGGKIAPPVGDEEGVAVLEVPAQSTPSPFRGWRWAWLTDTRG
jgi:hypothetical protein